MIATVSPDTVSASEDGARATPERRAAEWWRRNISDSAGDRQVRAQLRRCRVPFDALPIPAAIGLAARLGCVPAAEAPVWQLRRFDRALTLAIVLAHVRADSSVPLFRALGWASFPGSRHEADMPAERPKLPETRFRRFLQADGEAELVAGFSRLVRLAGGEANVENLARIVLRFEDDRTRRDLGLTYFHADDRSATTRD